MASSGLKTVMGTHTPNTVAGLGQKDALSAILDSIINSPSSPAKYSLEVSATDDFDVGLVEQLSPQPVFCSLPWISDNNLRYEDDFLRAPPLRVAKQLRDAGYAVMNHVSCYNTTKPHVDKLIATGIRNVFVIRGDTVSPGQTFINSAGLVQYLRTHHGGTEDTKLTVAVGGYPYGHHQSTSEADELRYLHEKINLGVDFLLTQTLYDADSFFRYRDRCRLAGISIPLIPGIYVPFSYRHLQVMLKLTQIQLKPDVHAAFEAHAGDTPEQFEEFMADYFTGVVRELLEPNDTSSDPVRMVHFFSFNKFALLQKVLRNVEAFGK